MKIEIDKVTQFLQSIIVIFDRECENLFTEDIIEYYTNIDNIMSPLLSGDLNYFFKDTGLGFESYCHDKENNLSVREYIDSLDSLSQLTGDQLMDMFVFSKSQFKDERGKPIEQVLDSVQKLSNSTSVKYNIKKGLLELYKYPKETIIRLKSCLERYYNEFYQKIEDKVVTYLEQETQKLEEQYKAEDPLVNEIKRISVSRIDIESIDRKYIIGYFPAGHLAITINSDITKIVVIFHYTYFNKFDPVEKFNKAVEFIKIISDDTRIKIIKLLRDGPRYSSEIASELGLNRATVSYHMDKLKKHDVLKYNLEKKKIYFSLHREKFEKSFNNFLENL